MLLGAKTYLYKHRWLLLVLSVALIGYWRWLSFNTFFHGDAGYYSHESLIDQLKPGSIDVDDFGSLNLTLSRYPTLLIQSLLAYFFNVNSSVGDKFVYLWPFIIIMPLSAYYLAYQITKNSKASAAAGLIFAFNTYFLSISTQGQELISLAGGFCILSLALLVDGIKGNNKYKIVLSALSLALAGTYDFRIVYIFAILFIFLAALYFNTLLALSKRLLATLAISVVLYIGLSLYWLLPLAKSSSLASNDLFGQNLFGGQYWSLPAALNIFQPFWHYPTPTWFFANPVPYFLWLIPIMAIAGLMLMKRKKVFVIAGIVALIGVLLSKQTAAPFGQVYTWLYANLPGFNAFREATKFYVLIAIGYSVLISGLIVGVSGKNYKLPRRLTPQIISSGVVIICIGLAMVNLVPYVTGSIGTNSIARHEPKDYLTLQAFLDKQDNVRTLWLPNSSRWISSTSSIPKVEATDLASSLNINSYDYGLLPAIQEYDDLFSDQYESSILQNTNIEYYIVPLRDTANDDDFISFHGDDREAFIKILDSKAWLKPINIGLKQVKVYENVNYKPYFNFDASPSTVGDSSNDTQYANFVKSIDIGKDINFLGSGNPLKPAIIANAYSINDAFENITASNIKNNNISTSLKSSESSSSKLYVDADLNRPSYSFSVTGSLINFISTIDNQLSFNGAILGTTSTSPISSNFINPTSTYYFSENKNLYPISTSTKGKQNIGYTTNAINLFSSEQKNLVINGSFEDGTWQDKVEDCNDYDNDPIISMTTSNEFHTEGNLSLELGSSRHIACTTSNVMSVKPSNYYSLRYRYKLVNSQRAGYDLLFNDRKHTILSADQNQGESQNGLLSTYFEVPAGATTVTLRLKGYSDDHGTKYALTYYDDVHVSALDLVSSLAKAYTPTYTKVPIKNVSSLSVKAGYNPVNTLENSNLNTGLWQKKVGDCNNYDNKPKLGMKLLKNTPVKGDNALELSAESHVACTSPDDPKVNEGNTYLLSFNYQNTTSNAGGYSISFDDLNGTNISKSLNSTDNKWHHYSDLIQVPFGAKTAHITFYSYSNDTEPGYQVNKYYGFSFVELPDINNRYYVVSQPTSVTQKPKNIKLLHSSATSKIVKISGARSGFFINMNDSFSNNWDLSAMSNNKSSTTTAINQSDHYELNGLLNSWYVNVNSICGNNMNICEKNKDGSWDFDLVASYSTQKYMNEGIIVSAVAFALSIVFLLIGLVLKVTIKVRS